MSALYSTRSRSAAPDTGESPNERLMGCRAADGAVFADAGIFSVLRPEAALSLPVILLVQFGREVEFIVVVHVQFRREVEFIVLERRKFVFFRGQLVKLEQRIIQLGERLIQ